MCNGPVDLDLVKVSGARGDSVRLQPGCTGSINRVEVDTWTNDGIKVAKSSSIHDVVINSGYITCHAMAVGAHQDGIQVMGGLRLTFKNLDIDCPWSNANFFISGSGIDGAVCDGCNLRGGASHTALVQSSNNSGLRNTIICRDRTSYGGYFDRTSSARNLIDVNNTIVHDSLDLHC